LTLISTPAPYIGGAGVVQQGKTGWETIMRAMMCTAILGLIFLTDALAWGHGTGGTIRKTEGILVSAEYDDGEPMSYAVFEITGPEDSMLFQKGRTDRNGAFMFFPDKNGRWQIVVQDRIGHRLALETEVTGQKDDMAQTEPRKENGSAVSRRGSIIAGISIIFGVCGFVYGWKARRNGADGLYS
jgi:nickel transport protein